MILLIDNYDSFSYNLYQMIRELGHQCQVVKNDELSIQEIRNLEPLAIVLSPGPGNPQRAGISLEVVREFAGDIPILGVCLGHQTIAEAFGHKVILAKELVHGKVHSLSHHGHKFFRGVSSPYKATRYHSLIVELNDESELEVISEGPNGEIMAIAHKSYPILGVQFHPESFGTPEGKTIVKNFFEETIR